MCSDNPYTKTLGSGFFKQLSNPFARKRMICCRKSGQWWRKSVWGISKAPYMRGVELTCTPSVEDLYNLRDICKTFCIYVSTLTQLFRIVACKLERRIPTQ